MLLFFPKLGKKPIKGRVKRAYPQSDLAILEVPSKEAKRLKGIPNLEISRETVPKFTTAYALGFPLGCDDVQISEGVISGWEDTLYHMNISINSGNSGGPRVDSHGGWGAGHRGLRRDALRRGGDRSRHPDDFPRRHSRHSE